MTPSNTAMRREVIALTLVLALYGCSRETPEESDRKRAMTAQQLWVKADAGDKSAKRKLGQLYWTAPTNIFAVGPMRNEFIQAASEQGGTSAEELQRLFNKADAGDKDARGEIVMRTLGGIFRLAQQYSWSTNTTGRREPDSN